MVLREEGFMVLRLKSYKVLGEKEFLTLKPLNP